MSGWIYIQNEHLINSTKENKALDLLDSVAIEDKRDHR